MSGAGRTPLFYEIKLGQKLGHKLGHTSMKIGARIGARDHMNWVMPLGTELRQMAPGVTRVWKAFRCLMSDFQNKTTLSTKLGHTSLQIGERGLNNWCTRAYKLGHEGLKIGAR